MPPGPGAMLEGVLLCACEGRASASTNPSKSAPSTVAIFSDAVRTREEVSFMTLL